MPPYVSRKRRESASPPPPAPARKRQKNVTPIKKSSKTSVFDAVDTPKPASSEKPVNGKIFAGVEDSESSSESDVDSDDFEDVEDHVEPRDAQAGGEQSDEDESWEDALHEEQPEISALAPEMPGEDLELTLTKSAQPEMSYVDLTGKKQGPSKRDKKLRDGAHRLHVQSLMWHNHLRNHWINDKEVQKTMVAHVNQSQKMKIQLDSWRRKAGIPDPSPSAPPKKSTKSKSNGKGAAKVKGRDSVASKQGRQGKRDWVDTASRPTVSEPDLSHGDPILPLLNTMAAWWRQRFTITAPGLRKHGYRQMRVIKEEMQQWRNGESDITVHGERVASLKDFQSCARRCEGSRDVGNQLFAALLRGLGVEARLVASLQPLGYGFTKQEEAELRKKKDAASAVNGTASKQAMQKGGASANATAKKSTKAVILEVSDTSELSDSSSSDDSDTSVIDMTPKRKPNKSYDNDLFFPNYWIEAVSSTTDRVFPVDPFVLRPAVATSAEHRALFEAKGKKADMVKQVFAYVVAFSPDYSAKDVTVRYLKNQIWPGRTKGSRVPNPRVAVYDRRGQVIGVTEVDWWQSVLRVFRRLPIKRTRADDVEDEAELRPVQPQKKQPKEGDPDTLAGYKSSTKFVLEQHLRRDEALLPDAVIVKTFKYGKGDKAKEDPVYLRKDVVLCRTGESWHKEGRQIKQGEQPLKMVKVRAVTLTRKREIEEAERETGEKAMQGMYGIGQTEWIIPPPIKDGIIPKNAFGNIDAFVPQMIPRGAIHLPMKGTVRVCKKMEIDFAEAVTGFEFGNKMAVPVIQGVVVAEENAERVTDAWEKYEKERKAKEEAKREKQILHTWRKFLMGLRVLERMKADYEITIHDETKERNPFANRKKQQADAEALRSEREDDSNTAPAPNEAEDEDSDGGGGFLPYDEDTGGGFLPEGQDAEITNNLPHRPGNLEQHHELKIEHDEDEERRPSLSNGKFKSLAELAAQQSTKLESSEQEEGSEDEEPPPKRKKAPVKAKAAPITKPKPRGRKPAIATKAIKSDSDELSALSSDDEDSAISGPEPTPPPPPPSSRSTRATRASARSAARESQQKIRSHYFKHESTMEIDDSEDEDELSAVAEAPVKRGRKAKSRKT